MGCFIMPKGIANKRYTPEFKQLVVETMREERLSMCETMRRFEINDHGIIKRWERIYLEEGPEGLAIERRGRKSIAAGRAQLSKAVEEDLIAENQRLRAENEYLKNLQALVLEEERRQRQKTQVIQTLRLKYPLLLLLEIAQLPRATFYYYLKRMQRADKYAGAKEEIAAIYHENKGRYGYRRITMALHSRGFLLNHKTVQRLMRELGLVCRVRIKKYRSYKGEVGRIAPNLLNRDFYALKSQTRNG